jgi:Flp pilus assembly protein CpaB
MRPMRSLTRRTRRRGMILAGGVGFVALTLSMLSHPRSKPAVLVAVTRRSLAAGTVLNVADVMTESVLAPGLRDSLSLKQVVGHSLAFGVAANQVLVAGDVVRTPELDGLKSNEVAVMLPVSLASSDNVQPNARVDVIWLGGTATTSSATAPGTILATGLRVLSVLNQNGSPVTPEAAANGLNASTPAVVEVAVPQAEAGTIAVSASSGRFWLALNPWAGPQDATPGVANVSAPISAILPSVSVGRSTQTPSSTGPSLPSGRSLKPSGTPSRALSPQVSSSNGTHASKTRPASPPKASSSTTSGSHHG